MRWLVISLLVSVVALLLAAAGMAKHVRWHKRQAVKGTRKAERQKIEISSLSKIPDTVSSQVGNEALKLPEPRTDSEKCSAESKG